MPEFDAPHLQPEQPPPSEKKLARKLPVAFIITLIVSAAALALLAWFIWLAISR